jgi:hypothetical protein
VNSYVIFYLVAFIAVVAVEFVGIYYNLRKGYLAGGRTITEQVKRLLASPVRWPVRILLTAFLAWLPNHLLR